MPKPHILSNKEGLEPLRIPQLGDDNPGLATA